MRKRSRFSFSRQKKKPKYDKQNAAWAAKHIWEGKKRIRSNREGENNSGGGVLGVSVDGGCCSKIAFNGTEDLKHETA